MVFIMVMQEFDRKLAEVSGLIRGMEHDSYHFETNVIRVVLNLEQMAEKYALPIQAELAVVRGKLLCGYALEKGQSRKERDKEKKRYVVEQLEDVLGIIEDYFSAARKKFDKCEQLCGQIIVSAYYKGMYQYKKDLYESVQQDEELAPHLAEVQGAVGFVNSKVIFEQAKEYVKYPNGFRKEILSMEEET